MTAVIIFLNVVFAAIVVVGMVTLLGRSIVSDARATGQKPAPSWRTSRLRPRFGFARARWSGELDAATR